MSKNLNYNTDIIKHYVRYHGWLKPFKTIVNHIDGLIKRGQRADKCKYLTFCAVQAIDVFMFEQLKYLYRNENSKRLENVYYCENDEQSFSIIQRLIGSSDQGFFGDFKKIVLLKESDVIVNSADPFDEPETAEEREKLRLLGVKKSLVAKFPFDVINLDLYGNFFPENEAKYSETFQTYQQILQLQKLRNGHECRRFLMYLTVYTPITDHARFIKKDVMSTFEGVLLQNLMHEEFSSALEETYGHSNPKKLDVYIKFILGFTKQVLFKETYNLGWQPKIIDILCYDRQHPADKEKADGHKYKITTFIVEYTRNEELEKGNRLDGDIHSSVEKDYKEQLFSIVTNKPEEVPSEREIDQKVSQDLKKIVEFRNKFLEELGIFDKNLFA